MRNDATILEGVVPGSETVVFGGKEFPLREPGLSVFAEIVDSVMDLQGVEKKNDRVAFKKTYDTALEVLKLWDREIGAEREWILENATPRELMQFFAKASNIVVTPLASLPEALGAPVPAKTNRQTRRAQKKSGR